ncbi:MAG: PAC2 family protein [Candidatus Aenigmatarchaeota archaeon]
MVVEIIQHKKLKLKDAIFIEGMPGVGNVGQIAVGYLLEELKPELFAELYTSHFNHVVLIKPNAVAQPLMGYFYYYKPKNLVIYYGDQQAISPEGTYELVNSILKFIKRIGVSTVITLGGVQTTYKKTVKVYGVVSEESVKEMFKDYDIDFENVSQNVGSIIGAIGMLTAFSKRYGMKSLCLLAESSTLPLIPDQRGAKALLELLSKILNIKIDLSKIERKAKEQQELMKKLSKPQEVEKEEKEETKRLSYLG